MDLFMSLSRSEKRYLQRSLSTIASLQNPATHAQAQAQAGKISNIPLTFLTLLPFISASKKLIPLLPDLDFIVPYAPSSFTAPPIADQAGRHDSPSLVPSHPTRPDTSRLQAPRADSGAPSSRRAAGRRRGPPSLEDAVEALCGATRSCPAAAASAAAAAADPFHSDWPYW